jgi:hypothetical protein
MSKNLCWILDEEDLNRQGKYIWDLGGEINFSHINYSNLTRRHTFDRCAIVLLKKKDGKVVQLKNRFK